ncbi:MAG TPA: M43 family zinc metalloprotease, partial [Adhaeribacter sp.]|nr:M43 family zinc metalloprotease [Adhaeribacter sp.]
ESGCDGISKAQVLNGLEVVNQDLRRQNPDTANTRAIFKPYAADTEIELVLARLDPNGQPTDGINRVTSPATKGPVNRDDLKTAVPAWDPTKYFNIWIVDNIHDAQLGANILGYAQFPHVPPLANFGVVLVHSAWGKQGAVAGATANTSGHYATHEIAHCFNLLHLEGVNCTDADLVADTPPADALQAGSACNFNQNTCTNDVALGFPVDMPDQVENFMSYSSPGCQNMFTQGQRDRMQAAFVAFSHLHNLVSGINGQVTGIDPSVTVGVPVPKPEVCPSARRICAGTTVTFNGSAFNAQATSWNWIFPGGTPATSTAQNPVVTYNTAGEYDVTLAVGNSAGSQTRTWSKLIKAVPVNGLITVSTPNYYVENFEEATFPVSSVPHRSWEMYSSSLSPTTQNWSQVNLSYPAGSAPLRSLVLKNDQLPPGTVSTLITPNFYIGSGTPPHYVGMYLAYAPKNNTPQEVLKVFFSTDCGLTWSPPVLTLAGNQLVTNGGTIVPNNYVPYYNFGQTDWRLTNIHLPSSPSHPQLWNASTLMFKIEVESNGGGNLYLDHFFMGSVLGTNEELAGKHSIKVSPNPLTPETAIGFELKTAEKASVKILDMVGRTVYAGPETSFPAGNHSISLAEKVPGLKAGVYMVQLNLSGKIFNTKLLVH